MSSNPTSGTHGEHVRKAQALEMNAKEVPHTQEVMRTKREGSVTVGKEKSNSSK